MSIIRAVAPIAGAIVALVGLFAGLRELEVFDIMALVQPKAAVSAAAPTTAPPNLADGAQLEYPLGAPNVQIGPFSGLDASGGQLVNGAMVQLVAADSPLIGHICPNDVIIAVNGAPLIGARIDDLTGSFNAQLIGKTAFTIDLIDTKAAPDNPNAWTIRAPMTIDASYIADQKPARDCSDF